ncbi:hypothetical protein NWE61_03660 [Mycoplasmopsis felis]|uniref:hypothetical protein n=1 Tax=Mycoplasmopsis felis TaxID=33923 RepID=UPI0021AE8427|nr:hypothetical protein [Mycoplasmopsis felis]MCU9934237.1 hypothetical protein [Mycoplasmopsis felis]MCU9938602.1 hypothetical protein [Mycoplasmopsis felis]UWV79793.1 hypothetical protein NW072_01185 [Mycoplasmopsis felis]
MISLKEINKEAELLEISFICISWSVIEFSFLLSILVIVFNVWKVNWKLSTLTIILFILIQFILYTVSSNKLFKLIVVSGWSKL